MLDNASRSILVIERETRRDEKNESPEGSRQPRQCSEPEDPSNCWGLFLRFSVTVDGDKIANQRSVIAVRFKQVGYCNGELELKSSSTRLPIQSIIDASNTAKYL